MGGAGTQTAGLGFGGNPTSPLYSAATEEYDGSAWTAGGNMGTARYGLSGAGTQTAGLGFGGNTPSPPNNVTEEYDGSTWTAGGTLNTARAAMAGCGLQTAGLAIGGNAPGKAQTEEYNGTSWTSVNSLNTGRSYLGGFGTQTSAVAAFGSSNTPVTDLAATEEYDGTSWTSNPVSGSTARNGVGSTGTSPAGVFFGGRAPPGEANQNATEEYTRSGALTTKTITVS
jgi:hypothetical protein